MRAVHRDDRGLRYYLGPDYDLLEDSIKDGLQAYVRAFGLTDVELLEMIEELSNDKEQRLYMEWLEHIPTLI